MLTGQMGMHKCVFKMSGRGDEPDGCYQRDYGYCAWVGSEGVQMCKMSVDIA